MLGCSSWDLVEILPIGCQINILCLCLKFNREKLASRIPEIGAMDMLPRPETGAGKYGERLGVGQRTPSSLRLQSNVFNALFLPPGMAAYVFRGITGA